jgi:phosphotransferase system enzyme I (PtsI)
MGYDQLSMNPRAIPVIRRVVRSVAVRDARRLAEQAAGFATAREIAEFLVREITPLVPMDLKPFLHELVSGEIHTGALQTLGG